MPTVACHCEAVIIDVLRMPRFLTQCTCSICRRYGALWAYCTTRTARVLSPPAATTAYMWNDKVIEFHHCSTCGCVTHYESVEKCANSRIAVNARMMSPSDVAAARIRTFDGADTWEYQDGNP